MVLLAKHKGNIIGGIRTKQIKIRRDDQIFNCLGIGEIFTSLGARGLGIAGKIVAFTIKVAEEDGYDLILGVARKNIDGFYLKHNFYGVGSYPKIIIKNISSSSNFTHRANGKYKFSTQKDFDISLNKHYDNCYSNVFGSIVRTNEDWKYISGTLKNNLDILLEIYEDNKLVGYLIHSGNLIKELSYDANINIGDLINDLSIFLNSDELHFAISSSHPLLTVDCGFDISVTLRECFYGGHIVRITNVNSVVQKFISREEKSFSSFNLNSLIFDIDNIRVDINSRGVLLNQSKEEKKIHSFWGTAKIDFPISYNLTKLLLGIKTQYLFNPLVGVGGVLYHYYHSVSRALMSSN
jgi:hypothetical protein